MVQTEAAAYEWNKRLFRKLNVYVIPNIFHFATPVANTKSDSTKTSPIKIMMTGRLEKVKDYPFALRCFSKLRDVFNERFEVHIYGQGAEESKLFSITRELGLENIVTFHGFVKNLSHQYIDSDLYVITSVVEGMPNSLGEAMSSGSCCLSLDLAGVAREMLGSTFETHGGQVVNDRKEEVFVSQLLNFVRDRALMKKLGFENQFRVRQLFCEKAFLNHFVKAVLYILDNQKIKVGDRVVSE